MSKAIGDFSEKKKLVLFAVCGSSAAKDIRMFGLTPTIKVEVDGPHPFSQAELEALQSENDLVRLEKPDEMFLSNFTRPRKLSTSAKVFFRAGEFSSVEVVVYEDGLFRPISVRYEIVREGDGVRLEQADSTASATSIAQEMNRLIAAKRKRNNEPPASSEPLARPSSRPPKV